MLFCFIDDGRVKYFYAELKLGVILIANFLIVATSILLSETDCDLLNTMSFKIDYCFTIYSYEL